MKNIKILLVTIAIIFSSVYVLNLEYFIKGIQGGLFKWSDYSFY
jgi:hypothetical protein